MSVQLHKNARGVLYYIIICTYITAGGACMPHAYIASDMAEQGGRHNYPDVYLYTVCMYFCTQPPTAACAYAIRISSLQVMSCTYTVIVTVCVLV